LKKISLIIKGHFFISYGSLGLSFTSSSAAEAAAAAFLAVL